MTEDIVYDDSGWPKTMRGHADVREFVEHAWRAFPDMTFEEVAGPFLHPTRAQASFQWRGWGTHTGPIDPPGVAPTGRRWETEGADFHTYRDGKVARLVIVFNAVDVMRQLGSLPEPGSAGERVAVALGNLQTRFRR
jgi:predicted ester cyclase